MTGQWRLFTGVLALCAAVAAAAAAGWLRPAPLAGKTIGALYQIAPPARFDAAMIRRGAAHYDRVCARCHGSPERPTQGRHLALTPPPPTLHLRLADWPPELLFRVVRDGIPNSAMPAWPAPQRRDEIWSMVAFLLQLHRMDGPVYRQWAGEPPGPDSALPAAVRGCVQCHGPQGQGQGKSPEAFPRLDLQGEPYLRDALLAFRDGRRASGIMQAATAGLTDAEIAEAARYYAGLPSLAPTTGPVPALVTRGDAARGIAACAGCHGTAAPVRPDFPRLAGQQADYLVQQMQQFATPEASGEMARGGGPFVGLMQHSLGDITAQEMQLIARWYAAQQSD